MGKHLRLRKPAEEKEEEVTGAINLDTFGTFFGNSLVLMSIGTIALVITPPKSTINRLSDFVIIIGMSLMAWTAYKYFVLQPKTTKLHETDWFLLLIVLACLTASVWLMVSL